jgi:hypothetical protein
MNTPDPPFLEFLNRAKGTLPETIGKADLSTLNSGLHFLFDRLRQAREQFEREGDSGRRGARTALSAFWNFITLFEAPLAETLHIPILRLQSALWMLDQGGREPILKPVRLRGRAPSSPTYDSIRGHAVATVQLLLQTGLARGDAHRAVATELRQLGVRPERGSGTVTATTVRNWCDQIPSQVDQDSTAALMYYSKLAPEEMEMFSAVPKDRAKQFALQLLASYVQSIIPELQKPT